MIHAFAVEPALAASWARREAFRFIHDKFGLGTPRALLELPSFTKWKRRVVDEARALGLSDEDMKRLEELFRLLGDHKVRRDSVLYDGLRSWLENAEREYDRRPFAAILATANPRKHVAVVLGDALDASERRWALPTGATVARTPEALSTELSAMLANCRELHLVDPHFGPENARHRKMLEAMLQIVADRGTAIGVVRIHCSGDKALLKFFEGSAQQMAAGLPAGITVEFVRWRQRAGGDRLHNRYVLTELGGVSLGIGLDAGHAGETDDVLLLPADQYRRRWQQYAEEDGTLDRADTPKPIRGSRAPPKVRGRK